MRRILAGLVLALLIASPVAAAKPVPTGTLVITSIDARFGGEVTFNATTADLKGYQYPLVYLECFQGSTPVYGQLDHPDTVFVLGGGSSAWWDSPGPATCQATLYAYGHDDIILLAEPLTFDSAG